MRKDNFLQSKRTIVLMFTLYRNVTAYRWCDRFSVWCEVGTEATFLRPHPSSPRDHLEVPLGEKSPGGAGRYQRADTAAGIQTGFNSVRFPGRFFVIVPKDRIAYEMFRTHARAIFDPIESDRRSRFLFCRIFFDEPVSTSPENALGHRLRSIFRIGVFCKLVPTFPVNGSGF